jgi:glutamate racemase
LILGCTHYPILINTIQETVGKNIKIIDPAKALTQELINILTTKKLLGNTKEPIRHFFFSDITPQTHKTVHVFFDNKFPGKLEKVSL